MSFLQFKSALKEALCSLPPTILLGKETLSHALEGLLEQLCQKHGMISAQEFETQKQVLYKTRLQVLALEKKIEDYLSKKT